MTLLSIALAFLAWGCGYAAPTARMQHTGRSFSELLGRSVPGTMRPKIAQPSLSFTDVPGWAGRFSRMRWLQQGILHIYVAYISIVLIGALAWMTLRSWRMP